MAHTLSRYMKKKYIPFSELTKTQRKKVIKTRTLELLSFGDNSKAFSFLQVARMYYHEATRVDELICRSFFN
ncbi:hypothetical protein WAF17_20950 [Bernardetia sp. ABR2-2B]|uniref:hypothetical protein n=1 Tax=Bernardetia sp. ABR2-2B TaxID=3127472 RepID=UPI0030CD0BD1